MKDLTTKLTEKAEKECTKLYYAEIQNLVQQFRKTFHLSESQMSKNKVLSPLWKMQYSNGTSTEVLAEILPTYTENYLDSFIKKVEEMQEMIENHDH